MSKIKDIYTRIKTWKFWLLIFAIIIGISSLFVTNSLVKSLAYEEKKKIEIWAYATNQMVNISDDGNFSLAIKFIPVIKFRKWLRKSINGHKIIKKQACLIIY